MGEPCWACLTGEYGLDAKRAFEIGQQENVRAVGRMIAHLYTMPSCDMGGPIHAIVEDVNVEDEHLELWRAEQYGYEPHTPEVMAHAQAILDALRPLTLQERAVATELGSSS